MADSGLRRVAVYAGSVHADLTLPAAMPVAALIVSIVDLLPRRAGQRAPHSYRLGLPGRPPLDGAKSLAQHGVRDGAVLALTRADDVVPEPCFDDDAEQVAALARATTQPWTAAARRLTAALTASGLAGIVGFVAVPGGPGTPNALLAAAAAGTVTALSVPSSGCSGPVRATLCCLGGLAVLAAAVGMVVAATGVSLQAVGAAAGAAAVGLIRGAGRVAAGVTGLSRRPAGAGEAGDLLTGLVAGASVAVVLGAAAVGAGQPVAGVPRAVGVTFAAAAGAALLLRSRSHTDGLQITALIAGGAATIGVAVLTAAIGAAGHRPWQVAVAAGSAGAAILLGFTAPGTAPLVRRGAEVLEGLTLGMLVPLACWICGLYGAARGLSLG